MAATTHWPRQPAAALAQAACGSALTVTNLARPRPAYEQKAGHDLADRARLFLSFLGRRAGLVFTLSVAG